MNQISHQQYISITHEQNQKAITKIEKDKLKESSTRVQLPIQGLLHRCEPLGFENPDAHMSRSRQVLDDRSKPDKQTGGDQ